MQCAWVGPTRPLKRLIASFSCGIATAYKTRASGRVYVIAKLNGIEIIRENKNRHFVNKLLSMKYLLAYSETDYGKYQAVDMSPEKLEALYEHAVKSPPGFVDLGR